MAKTNSSNKMKSTTKCNPSVNDCCSVQFCTMSVRCVRLVDIKLCDSRLDPLYSVYNCMSEAVATTILSIEVEKYKNAEHSSCVNGIVLWICAFCGTSTNSNSSSSTFNCQTRREVHFLYLFYLLQTFYPPNCTENICVYSMQFRKANTKKKQIQPSTHRW